MIDKPALVIEETDIKGYVCIEHPDIQADGRWKNHQHSLIPPQLCTPHQTLAPLFRGIRQLRQHLNLTNLDRNPLPAIASRQ